jgi:CheY-like chemotaxis protein
MTHILLIEDNQSNLELMTYLLSAFGHSPLAATDGAQGLALALTTRPALILCDIDLPTMDGYSIARRLKADPELHTTPLIAVTALAMVGDREQILAAGFDGYIAKPLVPEEFIRQIESFLPGTERSLGEPRTPWRSRPRRRATRTSAARPSW